MNDLLENLKSEFQDEDYRYAYAESFLNTKLAAQIKTLREQRKMTQAQAAAAMNIKQPGYRRFEDVNHAVWKTDSLWSIARAYGVRLDINFRTFGTLPDDKESLNKESLRLPRFEDDPAFKEADPEALKAARNQPEHSLTLAQAVCGPFDWATLPGLGLGGFAGQGPQTLGALHGLQTRLMDEQRPLLQARNHKRTPEQSE